MNGCTVGKHQEELTTADLAKDANQAQPSPRDLKSKQKTPLV